MTQVAKIEREATLPADPMVSMIERVAMSPDADLAKLERMLELRDQHEKREAEKAFNRAFASASAAFPTIPLNGRGHNQKPYAKLSDIMTMTRPALSENGLTLSFAVEVGESVVVTAELAHEAGHSKRTSIALPRENSGSKNPVQAVGSSQTYGQRYTAQAILGLSLGEDTEDDGRGAGSATITEDQFHALRNLIASAGADEGKLCAFFRIDMLGDLPAKRCAEADAMLRQKIKAKGAQA